MRTYVAVACAILSISSFAAAQSKSTKPEALGGRYYSKAECLQIARWVNDDNKRIKNLIGIEVGNFWYTLDNCGFLYFSDAETLNKRPSDDQLEMEVAIDKTMHEYIDRLEAAISRLSPVERAKIVDDLKKSARPNEGKPLWATDK
jgi:hypothetical protein